MTNVATLEELLQFIYLTPVGVVKFRADGAIDLLNPVASSLLLSVGPSATLRDLYAVLASVAPDLREAIASFQEGAGTIIDQHWLRTLSGGMPLTLSLTVNKIADDCYMAVLSDVTKLADQEHLLFADRQKFFAIFDHVRDYAIYTITIDGHIDEWNESVQRYAGWLATDVEGRSLAEFFPLDDPDRPDLASLIAEALRVGSTEIEGWRRKKDGKRMWANSVITALPDEGGTVRGFVVVSRDMTERKRLEDNMKQLATVDSLTGAYNRRQGDALLAAEFSRRSRDGRQFALLMLDIDNFKAVNDRYGHLAGDSVLVALVRLTQKAIRPVDILIRWGGEEFLIVLPDTSAAPALVVAERVRAEIAAIAIPVGDGKTISFTVSIGVALPREESPIELVSRADTALYQAKNSGRNRVVIAS